MAAPAPIAVASIDAQIARLLDELDETARLLGSPSVQISFHDVPRGRFEATSFVDGWDSDNRERGIDSGDGYPFWVRTIACRRPVLLSLFTSEPPEGRDR